MSVSFDPPKSQKSRKTVPTILKRTVESLIDEKPVEKPLDVVLEKEENRQRRGNAYTALERTEDAVAKDVVKRLSENHAIYPPVRGKETLVGRLKSLQGRILTIMDAAFADPAQREAIKTLINKEFRRDIGKVMGKGELISRGVSFDIMAQNSSITPCKDAPL